MTEPTPPPVESYDEPKRDLLHDKRALAIIGAAVVAVVAVGGFVVLPKLSGSSSTATAAPIPHGRPKVSATPSASAAPAAPAGVATAAPALHVRDPFVPLVVSPVAAAAPTTAASPTAAASPSTPTIVVVQPTSSPATSLYVLKLDKVTQTGAQTGNAVVELSTNGGPAKTYTVQLGHAFPSSTAGPFALAGLGVDDKNASFDTATFYYGDDKFALTIGEKQSEN